MKAHAILITTLVAVPLHADPRTSANYRLEPETVDGGGGRSSSTNYALDSQSDDGDERTVTDLDARDPTRLYRVSISRHEE